MTLDLSHLSRVRTLLFEQVLDSLLKARTDEQAKDALAWYDGGFARVDQEWQKHQEERNEQINADTITATRTDTRPEIQDAVRQI